MKFWCPWSDVSAPRTPEKMKFIFLFFNILDLNFKCSYQMFSLSDMHTDIGERIAWKQDVHIFDN